MAENGGTITRITGGDFLTEINGSWNVYTDIFVDQAGAVSAFTATEGTNQGEPETDDDSLASYFEEGWRSVEEEGRQKIKKAQIGNIVYFHIKTKNITENDAKISLQLYDHDGIFNRDDKIDIFLENSTAPLVSKEVINNKVVIPITLTENLVSYIEDDFGTEIELYFE